MTKKISVLATLCLLLGCLAACGDSTGSSDSSGKYSVHGDEVRATNSRTIAIAERDDANRTLTLVGEETEDLCVLSEGSAEWQTVGQGVDTLRYRYGFGSLPEEVAAFVRDTLGFSVRKGIYLALTDLDEGHTQVLVGGDSSGVDGTWHFTGCVVVSGGVDCSGAELLKAFGVTDAVYRISDREVVAKAVQSWDKSSFFGGDPFESKWAAATYGTLSAEDGYVVKDMTARALFDVDSGKVAKTIEALGIEILSQTERSQTFVMYGKEIQLDVNRMEASLRAGGVGVEYSAVTWAHYNGTSCYFEGRATVGIGKDDCSEENLDSFLVDFVIVDEDRNESVDYAYGIRKDNAEQYLGCLKILPWLVFVASPSAEATVAPPPVSGKAYGKAPRLKLPFFFRPVLVR